MKSLMQKVKRGYFTAQNFDSVISVKTVGEGFDFRAYLENKKSKLSPWHDLPLKLNTNETDQFVAFFEIPK
jgi:hypothetical protein